MKVSTKRRFITVLTALAAACATALLVSCERTNASQAGGEPPPPAGSDGWLKGSSHEKFDTIAGQFGGFSATMVEVGYRYTELYWAGEDENWDFAEYQLEHIVEAMDLGFERRPARRASSRMFMERAIPEMEEAITQRDVELFRTRFQNLAMHCNACHAMEQVPFINVQIPTVRYHPWGAPPRRGE